MDLYTSILVHNIPYPELNEAHTTLILKPEKNPEFCNFYQSISFFNTYYKLLAKIISDRIQTHISTLFTPHQLGFLRNKHSIGIRTAIAATI